MLPLSRKKSSDGESASDLSNDASTTLSSQGPRTIVTKARCHCFRCGSCWVISFQGFTFLALTAPLARRQRHTLPSQSPLQFVSAPQGGYYDDAQREHVNPSPDQSAVCRYNPKVSPVENNNLPAVLLSCFDFLFLLLDKPLRDDDERLAQHVTYVYMYSKHPDLEYEPLNPALVR